MSVLVHEGDFESLAWEYFKRASEDGVLHAEVFFDPQAHLSRGISYSTVLSGLQRACGRAEQELDMTTELITCFLRHLPAQDSVSTFDHADVQDSFASGIITGIGLDSSELGFPPELFEGLYRKAHGQGLRRTAHAGEEGPVEFIADALNMLGVERIDHGIRLADDGALMEMVAAKGTLLTVCPLSNVVLRCVKEIKDVPIRKFLDAGVKFSINSDDPAYFGGHILDNHCAVQEAFGLELGDWEGISRASIEGSWCSDARKSELVQALDTVLAEWNGSLEG
jgi:adenosine deaminase